LVTRHRQSGLVESPGRSTGGCDRRVFPGESVADVPGLSERIPVKSFYEALEHPHDLAVGSWVAGNVLR